MFWSGFISSKTALVSRTTLNQSSYDRPDLLKVAKTIVAAPGAAAEVAWAILAVVAQARLSAPTIPCWPQDVP